MNQRWSIPLFVKFRGTFSKNSTSRWLDSSLVPVRHGGTECSCSTDTKGLQGREGERERERGEHTPPGNTIPNISISCCCLSYSIHELPTVHVILATAYKYKAIVPPFFFLREREREKERKRGASKSFFFFETIRKKSFSFISLTEFIYSLTHSVKYYIKREREK